MSGQLFAFAATFGRYSQQFSPAILGIQALFAVVTKYPTEDRELSFRLSGLEGLQFRRPAVRTLPGGTLAHTNPARCSNVPVPAGSAIASCAIHTDEEKKSRGATVFSRWIKVAFPPLQDLQGSNSSYTELQAHQLQLEGTEHQQCHPAHSSSAP